MRLIYRPVPHAVSQSFGVGATRGNPHPVYGDYQPVGHLATDLAAPSDTPIVAATGGTVAYSGWGQRMPSHTATKYGYMAGPPGEASGIIIIIDHGDGTATAVSHLNRADVFTGQRVEGGQVIGLSGSTGRSTGPHVHFEYMTLPINYGSPYYSRQDPMAQYGANVVTVGATIKPLEDELNKEQNDALAEVWKRTGRHSQILEALDVNVNSQRGIIAGLTATVASLAQAVGSKDVDVDAVIRDAIASTASTHYVKAKEDATVYALSPQTGKLRPVTLPEWNVAHAAGIPLRIVPQKFIEKAPKEEK